MNTTKKTQESAKAAARKRTPTPTPLPNRRAAPRVPRAPVSEAAISRVCGLTDPFCEHARGAKYPDDSSAKTLSFTIHQSTIVSSDAQGELGVLIVPTVGYDPVAPGSVVGTTVTTTGLGAAQVATLSGVDKFRIVSCGYIVRNIAPKLTASGMIYSRTYSVDTCASLSLWAGNSYTTSDQRDIALADCQNLHVVIPHTSQMPQTFYPLSVNGAGIVTSVTCAGFVPTTIYGQGLPILTPCIVIEYIQHLEYVFDEGSALGLATTAAPPFSPSLTAAANSITAAGSHVFSETYKELSGQIKDKARTYLSTLLRNGVKTLLL